MIKTAFAILTAILITGSSLHAAEAPAEAQTACRKLLAAISGGDYPGFIADGDAVFKTLKKEGFDAVVAQLAARLKAGHEVAYLGELNQKGFKVTLWKLSFKDGKDDALGTLILKDGKVGGFWIR